MRSRALSWHLGAAHGGLVMSVSCYHTSNGQLDGAKQFSGTASMASAYAGARDRIHTGNVLCSSRSQLRWSGNTPFGKSSLGWCHKVALLNQMLYVK